MAEEETTPAAPEDAEQSSETESLGDGGKKALETERKARRDAEAQLKDANQKLQDVSDKDKSESERLTERASTAEKRAEEAEQRLARLEVAAEKGLTPTQAKRLQGANREELESDADELLEAFPGGPKDSDAESESEPSGSGRRPQERLRPGAAPDREPQKSADDVADEVMKKTRGY